MPFKHSGSPWPQTSTAVWISTNQVSALVGQSLKCVWLGNIL